MLCDYFSKTRRPVLPVKFKNDQAVNKQFKCQKYITFGLIPFIILYVKKREQRRQGTKRPLELVRK